MSKASCSIAGAVLALSLGGCAIIPTGTYSLDQRAVPDQTVLIRPAKEEERQYKPNIAARIFSVPAQIAQLQYIWPANDLSAGKSLVAFESVRVVPGAYLVKVQCIVGGYAVTYDMPVQTHAGMDTLIECTGATAANSRISMWEAPRSNVQQAKPGDAASMP